VEKVRSIRGEVGTRGPKSEEIGRVIQQQNREFEPKPSSFGHGFGFKLDSKVTGAAATKEIMANKGRANLKLHSGRWIEVEFEFDERKNERE